MLRRYFFQPKEAALAQANEQRRAGKGEKRIKSCSAHYFFREIKSMMMIFFYHFMKEVQNGIPTL
jgi:hypothetical protein